ncbi:MAG: hypothetical protein HWE23_06065 [Rhodobacteraceae bacterium]|nr:hypothetical protein [Paracoccaceae bacterium]
MTPFELHQTPQFQKNHFMMLTILLTILGLGYVTYTVSNWFGYWQPSVFWTVDNSVVEVNIGKSSFTIPKGYVTRLKGADKDGGQLHRGGEVKLAIQWPTFQVPPRLRALQGPVTDLPADILSISLSPASREDRIYANQTPAYQSLAQGPGSDGPRGLKAVTVSSPLALAITEVYFDPTGETGFAARCTQLRNTATWCSRKFMTSDGLTVIYNFAEPRLRDWPKMDFNMRSFVDAIRTQDH